jgi:hypothetical protein
MKNKEEIKKMEELKVVEAGSRTDGQLANRFKKEELFLWNSQMLLILEIRIKFSP